MLFENFIISCLTNLKLLIPKQDFMKIMQTVMPAAPLAEKRIKKDLNKVKDEVLKNLSEKIESVHSHISENMRHLSLG